MLGFLADDEPGFPGVGVAFTDRLGGHSAPDIGPFNVGRTDVDDPDAVVANVEDLRRTLRLGPVITLHQVHGAEVLDVDAAFADAWGPRSFLGEDGGLAPLPIADAAVTTLRRTPAVALCIRVADCVPVVLADAAAGVVGVAHAGRVGFAAGVLPAVVDAMRGKGATSVRAWIGPHVCGACYEVPAAMRAEIAADHPSAFATTAWGTPSLDLGAGCERQLLDLGCDVRRVDPCTLTTPELHSHRRDGARAGRLGGLVWLR